ncbi:MAG: hypothetical protein R2911_26665 [Caldilineaceae bacterium]
MEELFFNRVDTADEVLDVETTELTPVAEEKILVASQWKLMWWRFRKHRVAIISAVVVFLFYLIALFAEFMALHDPQLQDATLIFLTPQRIHFDGIRPYVYGLTGQRNPETLAKEYVEDTSQKHYIQFFVRGYEYSFWGSLTAIATLRGWKAGRQTPRRRPAAWKRLFIPSAQTAWGVICGRASCMGRAFRFPLGWLGWRSASFLGCCWAVCPAYMAA